jgi:hypothetical protein
MATAREMLERFLELGRLEWSEALDRPELFDLADLVRGWGCGSRRSPPSAA